MTDLLSIPDAMKAPSQDTWPPTEPMALPTKYELDPFQKHAVLAIHANSHVFVTAKTGSGKTFVGEYLVARALAAGGRVFYTTPIKSLSNQKYHDLKRLFPAASVGILTGDIKMCPDADVVVMTAEILRNLFYKRGTATENVGLSAAVSLDRVVGIVMDEVHYIQDPDRGHVWEESLILCPRHLQLVLLSATLPSAADLAGWLARLHGRHTCLLSTTYRVVPLEHGVIAANRVFTPFLDAAGKWHGDVYRGWLRERDERAHAVDIFKKNVKSAQKAPGASRPGQAWSRAEHDAIREAAGAALRGPEHKITTETPTGTLLNTVEWLQAHAALPALFFIFSRKRCETLAAAAAQVANLLDAEESTSAGRIFDFHLSRYRSTLESSAQYYALRELVVKGVAFHHSGIQPLLKEIVEILFSKGLIRCLFATETFAVGLNMPTRTVVFLELEKMSDGGKRRLLRADEYIQMAGRAGRRGLDKRGLVLYQPLHSAGGNRDDQVLEPAELQSMVCGSLPALESRMRFGYDFVLRQFLNPELAGTAEQSYWAFQQRAARVSLDKEIAALAAEKQELSTKFSAADYRAFQEKIRLEKELAGAKNAAARRLRHNLDTLNSENAALANKNEVWRRLQTVEHELKRRVVEAAEWDAAPLLYLDPVKKLLRSWAMLADGTLTQLGIAATECNEANCILLPRLVAEGRLRGVPADEIPVILAAMLNESAGSDEQPPEPGSLGLAASTVETLWWLSDQAQNAVDAEKQEMIDNQRSGFWDLSLLWVAVVAAWVRGGQNVAAIAAEYGLFEGNVLRGLMRVTNMMEELAAVAELMGDLELLEQLRSVCFLRGEIVSDSIYLRL